MFLAGVVLLWLVAVAPVPELELSLRGGEFVPVVAPVNRHLISIEK